MSGTEETGTGGLCASILRGINPLFDWLFGLSDEPPEGMAEDFREPEQGKEEGA